MATKKRQDGEKTTKGTQIRMTWETHARFKALAKQLGVSQQALLRAFSFGTPAEYAKCEARRAELQAGTPPSDES